MKQKDRKEKIIVEGNAYMLTLTWGNDRPRESGAPPEIADITCNGKEYAVILCASDSDGFTVEASHAARQEPEWRMRFDYLNISTIPFKDILVRLPL